MLDGSEDLWSMDEVERAVDRLRRVRPGIDAVVVKLNNGFSGQGNAIVEIDPDGVGDRSSWRTTFCAAEESWPSFASKIAAEGGVVERLVRTAGVASPSAQVSIAPGGDVRVVSTTTRSSAARASRSTSAAASRPGPATAPHPA